MPKFRKTKAGVAICPYFIWTSEERYANEQPENDVSLIHCNHSENRDSCEGNCQENLCPLMIE